MRRYRRRSRFWTFLLAIAVLLVWGYMGGLIWDNCSIGVMDLCWWRG